MYHPPIIESFYAYLNTNLFSRPSITAFLKTYGISYYFYKKEYENDLEFLDDYASFIYKTFFLKNKHHLSFSSFIDKVTSMYIDYIIINEAKIKKQSHDLLKNSLEELNYYFKHYVKKIYRSNIVEIGKYYVNLNYFVDIYLNILAGITLIIRDSKEVFEKEKICLLLDIFLTSLNIKTRI